ncbi:MAG TPA: PfkB family carbohydrate kinase [Candidatus Angelobacter sp.]
MKIVSIGEILWDVIGSAEHLGGAPFNFAVHARNLGHDVSFVSTLGNDQRGHQALKLIEAAGLSTRFVHRVSHQPTGTVTVSFASSGEPRYHIHRPAAYDFPALRPTDFDALLTPPADWIYFGTLQQMSAQAHDLTLRLLAAAPAAQRFYDVNLRINSYTPDLVRALVQHADVFKLNEAELPSIGHILGIPIAGREQFCRDCARRCNLEAISITRGAEGCALLLKGEFIEAPGFPVQIADTIGAGDAFSAALVHGINAGWPALQISDFANRVGALVASRPGGTPRWTLEEVIALQQK